MTSFNQDGYLDAIVGNKKYQNVPYASNLARYSRGGIYSKVVDLPCEKAVDRGIDFGEDYDFLHDEFDRLDIYQHLSKALKWAFLTGAGALVMVGDDGDLSQPVQDENLDLIDGFRVYSAHELSPSPENYTNPNDIRFDTPIYYTVNGIRIHESRVIGIKGADSPVKDPMPFKGRPDVDGVFTLVHQYECILQRVVQIMERKQQAVYTMTGLADSLLMPEGEAAVQKRINLVDTARGLLNTVAVDALDSYTVSDLSVGGIPQVIQEFQIAVSAATNIPLTILMGRSPAGMNSTGDSDFKAYYDYIAGLQNTRLNSAIHRILELISFEQHIPSVPTTFEWEELYQPTEKSTAEVDKLRAETKALELNALTSAITSGLLTVEEARKLITY